MKQLISTAEYANAEKNKLIDKLGEVSIGGL
jgi:hypothetical protein